MPKMTDIDVRNAKSGEHTDGDRLLLVVRPSRKPDANPRRSWVLRIMDGGRPRKLGLGVYPSVSLAQARQKAVDARRNLAEGIDPSVSAKRRARHAEVSRSLTLGKAIDDYLAKAAPTFKNAKSSAIRERALRVHFAPLHSRDVASIMVADVAGILRTLKPQTAVKCHAAVRAVFDYAATVLEPHGVRMVNPADPRRLRALGWTPKSTRASTPHPALDRGRMPEFMAELARHKGADARCLAFAILTIARAGAARLAKWSDIDLARRVWSVPVVDLKDSKRRTAPFIVPLSTATDDLLGRRGAECSYSPTRSASGSRSGHRPTDAAAASPRRLERSRHWQADHRAWFSREFPQLGRIPPPRSRDLRACLGSRFFHGAVERAYARGDLLNERREILDQSGPPLHRPGAEIRPFQARMTLSPQARRYARRLARNSFRVKPTEAEVAAMRAIIGDDKHSCGSPLPSSA